MNSDSAYLVEALKKELALRSKRNPRYSIRAFAKSSGIDQSLLTKIIAGKREMGAATQLKLAQVLGLPLLSSMRWKARGGKAAKVLDEEVLEFISDWIHFALLELLQIPSQSHELKSLASSLNSSTIEVRSALERLEKLGYLQKAGNRWTVLAPDNDWNTQKGTSDARKRLQKQLLSKAIEAIDSCDSSLRENSSLTLAVDPSLLPEIKKRILQFKDEINEYAASAGNPREVYQLSIAFFPLSAVKDLNNSKGKL